MKKPRKPIQKKPVPRVKVGALPTVESDNALIDAYDHAHRAYRVVQAAGGQGLDEAYRRRDLAERALMSRFGPGHYRARHRDRHPDSPE